LDCLGLILKLREFIGNLKLEVVGFIETVNEALKKMKKLNELG